MSAIGIDTHKATLAACAVNGLGVPLDERTFPNDPAGHRALAAWARWVAPGAIVGLEGSGSYGAAAARFLLAEGARGSRSPASAESARADRHPAARQERPG